MNTNPTSKEHSPQGSCSKAIVPLAQQIFDPRIPFWLGIVGFVLGQFITFYPGFDITWFTGSAMLVSFGLLVRSWAYRAAAIVLIILTLASFWTQL